ncbi:hypothetical protein H5410_058815 [Solanum commersonii]|uniref:Uncharacterized protein n=1 Tax=Solanum commersonii TaxID=4109 RepID=A0A9J5W0V5_SOLCO|nr:hypothetical protein H5410_058815 [Solanum commersonii]
MNGDGSSKAGPYTTWSCNQVCIAPRGKHGSRLKRKLLESVVCSVAALPCPHRIQPKMADVFIACYMQSMV